MRASPCRGVDDERQLAPPAPATGLARHGAYRRARGPSRCPPSPGARTSVPGARATLVARLRTEDLRQGGARLRSRALAPVARATVREADAARQSAGRVSARGPR